jgi:hypothetical protein
MLSAVRWVCNKYVVIRYTLHLYIGIEVPVTVHYLREKRGRGNKNIDGIIVTCLILQSDTIIIVLLIPYVS